MGFALDIGRYLGANAPLIHPCSLELQDQEVSFLLSGIDVKTRRFVEVVGHQVQISVAIEIGPGSRIRNLGAFRQPIGRAVCKLKGILPFEDVVFDITIRHQVQCFLVDDAGVVNFVFDLIVRNKANKIQVIRALWNSV